MTRQQKALTISLWGLLVIAMVAVIASGTWRRSADDLPHYYKVPEFSLIDHHGRPFTHTTLSGKVWLADFIFTSCAGPCPLMTRKMDQLEKSIEGGDVRFVSFTVDPQRDTPEALRIYMARNGLNENRWLMATGEAQAIADTAAGMKVGVTPGTGEEPIWHAEYFLLIDAEGWVRGFYHLNDPEKMKQLPDDLRRLAGARS